MQPVLSDFVCCVTRSYGWLHSAHSVYSWEHVTEIKEDLDNLIRLGLQIESITTDGHKSILKAIKKSLPNVAVQRCLVHIQRMCLLWLTRFPRHIAAIELRRLVLQLLQIRTSNDR